MREEGEEGGRGEKGGKWGREGEARKFTLPSSPSGDAKMLLRGFAVKGTFLFFFED